jgi:HAD superfamily hydrolase (TIGR01509 family)
MPKTAVIFGSIGSLAETSDIQRRAYNQALAEAGLGWTWDPETYADLVLQAGGRERLELLSAATGAGLSAERIAAIHERKTALACAEIVAGAVPLRPGVAAVIQHAKRHGMKLGFATTTYRPNIDAIFAAAQGVLAPDDFAVIVSRDDVAHGKPAPDAYQVALAALAVDAADAIAIEDTATSVMSAKRAGLTVVATPGAIAAGQDFWQADLVVDALAGDDGTIEPRVLALLA